MQSTQALIKDCGYNFGKEDPQGKLLEGTWMSLGQNGSYNTASQNYKKYFHKFHYIPCSHFIIHFQCWDNYRH